MCVGCPGVVDIDFFWWRVRPPDSKVGFVGYHGQGRARVWSLGLVLLHLRRVTWPWAALLGSMASDCGLAYRACLWFYF